MPESKHAGAAPMPVAVRTVNPELRVGRTVDAESTVAAPRREQVEQCSQDQRDAFVNGWMAARHHYGIEDFRLGLGDKLWHGAECQKTLNLNYACSCAPEGVALAADREAVASYPAAIAADGAES